MYMYCRNVIRLGFLGKNREDDDESVNLNKYQQQWMDVDAATGMGTSSRYEIFEFRKGRAGDVGEEDLHMRTDAG